MKIIPRAKLPRLITSQLCLRAGSRLPDPMTVAKFRPLAIISSNTIELEELLAWFLHTA